MKREDPKLHYGTNYMYLGGFIFTGVPTPLGKTCYKKGLVKLGLNLLNFQVIMTSDKKETSQSRPS